MIEAILGKFGLDPEQAIILPLNQGLINQTWKVEYGASVYILQRINPEVFREPGKITDNISMISDYLAGKHPEYYFVSPVKTTRAEAMVFEEGAGYFRMFPFVKGSHTKDTVHSAAEAYEAAKQFGKFTAVLEGFDESALNITIPGFHDISLRYQQFLNALKDGIPERIEESCILISELKQHSHIVEEFERIKNNPDFRLRVTHHDTKISNVLFDGNDKGLCVIDLDTVMPGYFISDIGDMMRTYLSPVSEEETDLDRIVVRPDYYEAIVNGYLSEMGNILTDTEKQYFFYAGTFLIYMQALRFLADYLNGDVYYQCAYPGQNLNRTKNQLVLLSSLMRMQGVENEKLKIKK